MRDGGEGGGEVMGNGGAGRWNNEGVGKTR